MRIINKVLHIGFWLGEAAMRIINKVLHIGFCWERLQ